MNNLTPKEWPRGETPPAHVTQGGQSVWATWIRSRSPEFKAHSSLGLAKSALSYHANGYTGVRGRYTFDDDLALYQWDAHAQAWILRVHITHGSTQDDYLLWRNTKAFIAGATTLIDEADPVTEMLHG